MTWIDSIILGIVEGITEFLPISSTGHMILASEILRLSESNFLKSFEITIQLGAILSVVVLYGRSLLLNRELIQKVLVAFVPTGVIGLLVYKLVKQYLLGNDRVVLAALLLGGLFLIVFELLHKDSSSQTTSISYKQAVAIGFIQCIAMVPGVSRSAATIIGGLSLGIDRKTIVEFSFLLAIPTMTAATGLDLYKNASAFDLSEVELLITGFVVSFVVAMVAIKFLLRFIQKHTFVSFGIYRVAVGILFWLIMLR